MSLRTLYHFTDEAGWKGIRNSLTIKKSPYGAYGEGVYLTDLSPEKYDKAGISLDIFAARTMGRVRYAVEVRLPDWKLTHHSYSRHIWTFEQDVDLECCEHYFLDWPDSAPTPIRQKGTVPQKHYGTKHRKRPTSSITVAPTPSITVAPTPRRITVAPLYPSYMYGPTETEESECECCVLQ